jgi:serine/threonine-protein kinase
MSDETRVEQLLDEISGSERTPEEVCVDCPELLAEVRNRWKQLRLVQAELDAMFPRPDPSRDAGLRAPPSPEVELPRIPGYAFEAVLGRGGMGIVYKARHLRLNRTVAIKMLLAGAYAGPLERERFLKEAEAVAGLRHPGIVQVHDMGEHDGRPYFTMEYVEGGSLAQKLMGTPQCVHYAADCVATLAEAVQAAHQSGIVHRDLKPANILLQRKLEIPILHSHLVNPHSGSLSPTPSSDLDCRISDFDPKIVDFGLARHFERDSGLTLSGARVGTPSYMAPEQALGKTHTIGPSADIYALGAVLYELLTGRPPFRGVTPTETELQVIHHDPVPPSRLNPRVPRDLETICLKCLEKDAARRYATAAALADDLRRLEKGLAINARRVRWPEKLWRWCRRKPAAAAFIATALALIGMAVAGARSLELRRVERREETARQVEAVRAALQKAADLQQEGRWPEARAVLDGAQRLLADSAAIDLVERVNRERTNTDMVARLEEIRLLLSGGGRIQKLGPLAPEILYADAFRNYGMPLLTLEPAEAAARIRGSSIRETLLAFIHDWLHRVPEGNRARLRDVLDRADDDGWRHAFREALLEKDEKKLSALANAPGASSQPPEVVSGLAAAMLGTMYKYEAHEFMRAAQQRHPGDFWINYFLGCFWCEECPQEAVGYFRVAVAIRPTSPGAHFGLGKALRGAGDTEGALAALRQSFALEPSTEVANELAWCLAPRGELEEARAAWEKFLEGDPPDHDAWYGYAQLCMFLGNEEAYRRARKALLKRFGNTRNDWIIAERTSLACMLLNDSGDDLRAGIRLADLAVDAAGRPTKTDNPYLRFVKGLALYRQGRPREAIPLLQEAAEKLPGRAGPRLAVAMAQFQSGSSVEARKTLAAAVRAYDWNTPLAASRADLPTIWVSHVLRREAEGLILPNLSAFLQGTYQPEDNDERIALLGICQSRGLTAAAARLYASAFAADPGLASQMTAECLRRSTQGFELSPDRTEVFNAACRYHAARCSALAGSGLGKDGDKLSEAERARMRQQAREWLRADMAMWAAKLGGDSPFERSIAKRILTNWQADPDLSGLREPQALDDLSADERKDCLALWHDVRALLKRTGQNRVTSSFDPKRPDFSGPSPYILVRLGRLNEAQVAWKSVLKSDPPEHGAWHGYAELCLFLGEKDEYRRARRDLLERFGATTDPYVAERGGRACLLMPATGDELQRFVAFAQRAVARNSDEQAARPWFEFTRGLAEYRQGQFERAISAMRGDAGAVLRPAPALVIAMALHQKGQADEARQTLASAVLSWDWSATRVRDTSGCILHVLRREAERMILPNLPAFMDGKYQPQDNDERLSLLGACQFTNRTRAMARIYADAFATAPSLADDLVAGHRYNAARAAAQAGCGRGADATGLANEEKARLRDEARRWLRADLAARARALGTGSKANRGAIRMTLARWQNDPDLASLRDPRELKKLAADEGKEFDALWADVAAVLARTVK